jgi:hypothetical protein
VRSVSQAADTVWYEPRHTRIPDTIKPGQVVGIPHLSISVGQGDRGASILSSSGHNVQLTPGTIFVLVPNLRADASAEAKLIDAHIPTETGNPSAGEHAAPSDLGASGLAPPNVATAELPVSDLANETELCVAPDCSVARADARPDEENHGAQMTMPLKELGYVPPANREMSSFDYDASVAYLGPNQFLFTFNPHTLVPRSGAEATTFRKLRLIRAVLIDLDKKEILKTVDWRIPDSGRYLWPIGQDRVLVHVGEELCIYGPGLKLRDQIPLGGQLAFVRVSPSSEYFAAGIIHERHTRETHRQLEEAELREP